MTIEELFRRGEISSYTLSVCLIGRIKTLNDIMLHYRENETFRNLSYIEDKSNENLIELYNRYKDVYIEDKTTQTVSENKSEIQLEDVVTDLNEVMKTTLTPDAVFEGMEQMLKDHWNKKDILSEGIDPSMSKTTESLEELEQGLKNHWIRKARENTKEIDAMSKSTYGRHPSKRLNDLYASKSYQGANPVDAKVIFVGRDPNWVADIEEREMFEHVVAYLTDGIAFWQKHNIHHPFLLESYKGDGRRHHRAFTKLELDSSVASKISFVDLIGFPTIGKATIERNSFKGHLFSEENIDNLIALDKVLNDESKIIFIVWKLIDDFKLIYERTGLFKNLANLDKSQMDITDLNQYENIFVHRDFSNSITNDTIAKMANKLRENLQ